MAGERLQWLLQFAPQGHQRQLLSGCVSLLAGGDHWAAYCIGKGISILCL